MMVTMLMMINDHNDDKYKQINLKKQEGLSYKSIGPEETGCFDGKLNVKTSESKRNAKI